MKTSTLRTSVLLAGLLAISGAGFAQTGVKADASANNAINSTSPKGEATTMTGGQPNVELKSSTKTRAEVKADAPQAKTTKKNTKTSAQGEASTMTNGQPNKPDVVGMSSRADVKAGQGNIGAQQNANNSISPKGEASTMTGGQPNKQ